MRIRTNLLVLATAGTFALGAVAPTGAAPITAGSTALKDAVPSDVVDVRWRGHGGAVVGGLALGLIGGALIAGATRPYYGYGYGYGYGYPAYGYGYAPAYYGPPVVYVAPRRRYWRRAWGPGPVFAPGPYWGSRPFYW
jgi:hypothetical protein